MRKQLLSLSVMLASVCTTAGAATFTIDDKVYDYDCLIKKEIGPGVTYHRLRIPDYPLNINYITVDLNNPYNKIETFQGQNVVGKTEKLANVYAREVEAGRKPLGGQNSNFWVVATQPPYEYYCMGSTFGGNLKAGQIITETNCYSNQWAGGPGMTGSVGIDLDKKLWCGEMSWKGYLKSSKWAAPTEFIQVNKYGNAGNELVLYNSYYDSEKPFQTVETYQEDGTTKYRLQEGQCTEVYLDLNENQEWAVNKDFTATVKEIKTNTSGGVRGNYDIALSATGNYKTLLEQLAVGDVVTLNYAWYMMDSNTAPNLTDLVSGNAIVLKNGELTNRNYGDGYNDKVYSRSAYGMSEDGKTLYMFVVDMSTDPTYGKSVGCKTGPMSQIMKQLGAWNVVNVDAGGSAQLMSQGAVVNRTTEGTPRAVANGWMVYSIAPETESSDVISRIEFLDSELNLPIYSSYKPVILGYNEYGELISENVEGFTLSGGSGLGAASGDVFNTLGTLGEGVLTATYGNITVSKPMEVVDAEVSIRASQLINDGRQYPIEVVSKVGFNDFSCDPSRLEWTVSDPEVAVIENGVLKGLKNGTATITGSISGFSTSATVRVELPEGETMPVYREFPADWTLKQTGGTGLAITPAGEGFNFTYTGNGIGRGAYISAESSREIWSMPKSLRVSINPGNAEVTKVSVSTKNGRGEVFGSLVFVNEKDGLPQNTVSTYDLPLSDIWDITDVTTYPVLLYSLRLDMGKSEKGTTYEIQIPRFEAVYGDGSGVDRLSPSVAGSLRVYPNPVSGGVLHVALDGEVLSATADIYDSLGTLRHRGVLPIAGGRGTLDVSMLPSGIYFVRLSTSDGVSSQKFIVK